MSRPLRSFGTWFSLAVFTITALVVPRGAVVCRDSHGARIEFACDRTGDGHCEESLERTLEGPPTADDAMSAAAAADDDPVDHDRDTDSCSDTTLPGELLVRGAGPLRTSAPIASIPLPPAGVLAVAIPARRPECIAPRGGCLAPPAARHLRSVILLV